MPRAARMAVYMTIKKATLKSVFLTGLLVLVPLAITLWVLNLVIGTMDQTLLLLPESWRPERVFGVRLPGLGAVLTLAFIFVVGVLTHNFIGQKLVEWWNALVRRIPIIGPLYGSIQQVSDTLLSSNGNAFRKALLIEYPRKGSWTIAFLTGIPGGDVVNHLQEDHVSVYVPTTPNPTSGFFLMVPKSEVVELDMTVDAALKYIVSMGVVAPAASPRRPIDPPL
ncbi:putative membrane protein [Paraburkholderia unamae]|uniref:Membrane protein n=2 Tax=Paraburkholderia unamae TaxID=219649 RepID=A0ABX5KM70_9BURK|nr:putative membrane protein [Paraburkholderia unamae]